MHAGNSDGQQPGPSRQGSSAIEQSSDRGSSQMEQSSGSLISREERSDDRNEPGPSNANQGSQLFAADNRQPKSTSSNQTNQNSDAQESLKRCTKKRNRTDSEENKPEISQKKIRNSNTDHLDQTSMDVDQDTSSRNVIYPQKNQADAVLSTRLSVFGSDETNKHPAHGVKNSLHGVAYQVKLLMLFLKRGLDKKYSFRLATEMDEAGNFGDLILRYENGDKGGKVHRFLQAKHKQDEKTKITANDLLTENDKKLFIQRYFISYLEIKENQKFNRNKDKIKDFIICTNIDFSVDLQNSFEPVLDEDDILDIEIKNKSKVPKRLKLKISCPLRKELISILREASHLNRLTKNLVEHIFSDNDKTINVTGLFEKYHGGLADKVIDTKAKQIKMDFINGSSDLPEVKKFREVLLQRRKCSEDKFWLKLEETNLKISNEFGNVLTLEEMPEITSKTPDPIQELTKKIVHLMSKKDTNDVVHITKGSFIIQENIDKLAGHVFIKTDNDKKKFRQGFLDGHPLPGNLNDLREALKTELSGTDKGTQFSQLDEYIFNINILTCTENEYNEYKKDKSYFKRLPNDEIAIEEIDDFLDHLVFVVNQPNEGDLGNIIKEEICKDFNLLDSDLIASYFEKEILDWMKEKGWRYLTHEEGHELFNEIDRKISKLKLSGNTEEYCNEITGFDIAFIASALPTKLWSFLTSKDIKIFNLCCSRQTILGSIKVYQVLKGLPAYERSDSYIFLRLSSVLCIQDHVIQTFNSKTRKHLLVIECDAADRNIEELYNEFSKAVLGDGDKKVILITQGNNPLVEKFKNNFSGNNKYEEQKDEKNSFTYLTPESQNILLNERQIIFQGKEITLQKLMENKEVNILSKQLDYLDKMIDTEALIQLMRNEVSIEVGTKQPHLSDLESFYYVASVTIDVQQFLNAVRNNPSDLFVIGGTTKYEFPKLIAKLNTKEKYSIRVLGEDNAREEDKFIILTNKDKEKDLEDFKRTCGYYSKIKDKNKAFSAHFIEKKNKKLIWKRSYDASFYIPRNLYHIVIKKEALKAHFSEEGAKKKDIFAISSIDESQFVKQYEIVISKIENVSTEADSNKKNHIIILKDENEEKGFENMCSNEWLAYYNIHLLQNKDSKLVWRRSEGEMNKIHEMRDTQSEFPIDKDDLNKIIDTEKAIVIAGDPGMGKSTTLTHLLKQPEEFEWIIKLNLINLQKQLTGLCGVNDLNGFIEKFFSKIDIGVKGKLAEECLKYRIEHQGKIIFLFDGFDEVTDENQKVVINLLRCLKNTKAKIQITTRLNVKDKLEDVLSVFSYTFQPFSEENQKEFLCTFWKASFKLTIDSEVNNDTLYRIVGSLFKNFDQNVKDKKYEFLSIPLTTRMLAEIYQGIVNDTYQGIVKDTYHSGSQVGHQLLELSKLNLYKEFIKRKYEIYFSEKIENSSYIKDFWIKLLNKNHQHLAIRKLFSKFEASKILADEHKLMNIKLSQDEEKCLKMVGIIQSVNSEGDPHFIHQSFAEYFAARLLMDMIGRREDDPKCKLAREVLLAEIFRDCKQGVRDFFGNMVQNKNDEDLNRKWKTIQDCDLLGEIEIKGLLFLDLPSVEVGNIRPEVQHDAGSGKSLSELRQTVESCMEYSEGGYYNYKGDVELINNLFQKFIKETDIETLKTTLKFLIKANGKSCNGLANEVFLRNDNIYNAIKHFLTQAKQQNKLNVEYVIDVFSVIDNFQTFKRNLTDFNSSTDEDKKKEHAKKLTHFLTEENSKLPFLIIKLVYQDIIPYISQNIEKLHDEKDIFFLDRNGIKNVKCFETLTLKMSNQFYSILDKLKDVNNIGYDDGYSYNIFYDLIMPIINMMKKDQLPNVDKLAFLKMLAYFTHFSVEQRQRSFVFTTEKLKKTLELIENVLKYPERVYEVLLNSTEYLFALSEARLKLIDADQKLLVLDPASEFQCELSNYKEEIVQLIKWKLENPDHSRTDFIKQCYEVVESEQSDLKRSRSENNLHELT